MITHVQQYSEPRRGLFSRDTYHLSICYCKFQAAVKKYAIKNTMRVLKAEGLNANKMHGGNISEVSYHIFTACFITELDKVMMPGSMYVTSLRSPPEQLKSLFHYFHLDRELGKS